MYNPQRMRGLVKLGDCIMTGRLVQWLCDVNGRLLELLFGVEFPLPPAPEPEPSAEELITPMPIVPGFDVVPNPEHVQQYYDKPKVEQDTYVE